jgi:hypothetical protein
MTLVAGQSEWVAIVRNILLMRVSGRVLIIGFDMVEGYSGILQKEK